MRKFYLLLLVVSAVVMIYSEYMGTMRTVNQSRLSMVGSQLDADIRDISYQSLLAFTEKLDAPSRIRALKDRINTDISELKSVNSRQIHPQIIRTLLQDIEKKVGSVPTPVADQLARIEQTWDQMLPDLDSLLAGQGATLGSTDADGDSSIPGPAGTKIISNLDLIKGLTGELRLQLQPDAITLERKISFMASGFLLLSLAGLFWSVLGDSRNTRQAVTRLSEDTSGLAIGDLTTEIRATDEVTTTIVNSINSATDEMRELITAIKLAAGELTETTEETTMLIARLHGNRVSQSEEVSSSAEEITNMTGGIDRIGQAVNQSTQQAGEFAELVQQGAEAVTDTVQVMDAVRNRIQESGNHLQQLLEKSGHIDTSVSAIRDIAERANVLSLNASIQAAAAGEAGREFAVIAEEFQSLTERSARASGDIDGLLGDIRQNADNAITGMQETIQEVASGATGATRVRRILNQIETNSQHLIENIDQLADDSRTESKSIKTVAGRMQVLLDSTAASAHSITQISAALEEIKSITDGLEQSTAGFRLPEPW